MNLIDDVYNDLHGKSLVDLYSYNTLMLIIISTVLLMIVLVMALLYRNDSAT